MKTKLDTMIKVAGLGGLFQRIISQVKPNAGGPNFLSRLRNFRQMKSSPSLTNPPLNSFNQAESKPNIFNRIKSSINMNKSTSTPLSEYNQIPKNNFFNRMKKKLTSNNPKTDLSEYNQLYRPPAAINKIKPAINSINSINGPVGNAKEQINLRLRKKKVLNEINAKKTKTKIVDPNKKIGLGKKVMYGVGGTAVVGSGFMGGGEME